MALVSAWILVTLRSQPSDISWAPDVYLLAWCAILDECKAAHTQHIFSSNCSPFSIPFLDKWHHSLYPASETKTWELFLKLSFQLTPGIGVIKFSPC